MNTFRIGLDVGSTTAKIVVLDNQDKILFSKYERHHADVISTISLYFKAIEKQFGNCNLSLTITGSVGMGIAERLSIPFIQEVVAATELVKKENPDISVIIDIGGEDAKIVYLNADGATDLRMNGNCAGGTGAFIDQMAVLLGINVGDLDSLAGQAQQIYPIASRCGVFSKTDIQNLMSRNVSKADIAASIFHAVAVQTIVTLSHGCEITPKILFCGGPLTFIPGLRQAFVNYLHLTPEDFITPENANIIPAWGAALSNKKENTTTINEFISKLDNYTVTNTQESGLAPIFRTEAEYNSWKAEKSLNTIKNAPLSEHTGYAYLGIDSGSTTTKIVVTDEQERILYSHYTPNNGNPIEAVRKGLEELVAACDAAKTELKIKSSCSTGYGEDLIKAAFNLNNGIIETIAHYVSARKINPQVSFILDIGGQDMKALFVENGVLNRMEINEACSSGCGSFIETFAKSLNYTVSDFAKIACEGKKPYDLGTRCTVFMNSKVKQALREGASIGDIAAGLSYSVAKNCLYKVLKLKNTSDLGSEMVVQGGTMRNDSVVRAFEQLTGISVSRSNLPELMGAYGCALYAKSEAQPADPVTLNDIMETARYTTKQVHCRGCENQCTTHRYTFNNGNIYYSGNKCEKVFSNNGSLDARGRNIYTEKYSLLFNKKNKNSENKLTLGIPRCLNIYENYPFWHTLFQECGLNVLLSDPSTFKKYEAGAHSVMSDNICFPAKLVHSHIYNLIEKRADRIFFPYVIYEKTDGKKGTNSFNCPIVSGYSDVIKSAINPTIPVDSPVITFKDKDLLNKGCTAYLKTLGIPQTTIAGAICKALIAQETYENEIQKLNSLAYQNSRAEGKLTILLAGRPYHTDPLIQHKLSDMITDMGVTMITEDIVRNDNGVDPIKSHIVPQWAYINQILKAAQWAAQQDQQVHFVQMTSFGCGPDAFLVDEVRSILKQHGKTLTLLKIDDVNNMGSVKLRVRSVIESLKYNHNQTNAPEPFVTTQKYTSEDKKRKIIAPFFTDYFSPLLPSLFQLAGYDVDILPEGDTVSAEYGLKYANNEVCYPATLIVGDIIKALESGKYDTQQTAVIITQTGGQCRASNYIALIKKGISEAGFTDVPVISLSLGSDLSNDQAQFKINWLKIIPIAFISVLYGDCISKFYHASVVREKHKGDAEQLRYKYLQAALPFILKNKMSGLTSLLSDAVNDFNDIIDSQAQLPKVGIVGEIFLKHSSFAHKNVIKWLIEQKIEVIPPTLTSFFTQSFVNMKVNKKMYLEKSNIPTFVIDGLNAIAHKQIHKINAIASGFSHYTPFTDIEEEAENGEKVVSLSAQYGEGWLLPAEVISLAKQDINHVISLQPFGCIANHIISKGVEKKIKMLHPKMNLLSLDFDSGVSDVNITNRLLLFINNLQ